MFLPKVTWLPACAARILYCNIRRCRSSCNGDILSRQAPTLANLQLDLHSQALPLCRTSHDRTRDNIHSCSLPQHSAFPSYFCCVPHAQARPPGLRPLFFRKDFVRRITSAFIFFLGGEECCCCLNSCRASHTFPAACAGCGSLLKPFHVTAQIRILRM